MLFRLTKLPRSIKLLILLVADSAIAIVAFWVAVIARVGGLPNMVWQHIALTTVLIACFVPSTGVVCGMYLPVTRFVFPLLSVRAVAMSVIAGGFVAAMALMGGAALGAAVALASVFALTLSSMVILSRHFARWALLAPVNSNASPVVVYGAGAAGRRLVSLLRGTGELRPAFFMDDEKSLHGRMVEGLVVLDPSDRSLATRLNAKGVTEILLAIPSLTVNRRRQILENLGGLPYRVRTVPSLVEVIRAGNDVVRSLREISVEDLLGRDGVPPQVHLLEKCIKGKGVLITGGGGSIGSELSRQVLALCPAELVVLDHSEFALYQIEQELRRAVEITKNQAKLRFILGSVTDPVTLSSLFAEGTITTVYHAAAYKHVPIVEECPLEGLRNNVLGTWQLARHAARSGVEHFILVSTDKAVRPTNVMGASKRMAELVIQSLSNRAGTSVFSIVRFGNVLGSSGSVVPLFKSQIERGGPITLTHPDVTRYFMTIQEAVQLVIQAGAMAQGGEVFVLDMGEPRRIADLARTMIRLSGRTLRSEENPDGDIGIQIVGLRPGEKLYEELLISGEATGTAHPRIWQVIEPGVDAEEFEAELNALNDSYRHGHIGVTTVEGLLKKWVGGYHKPCVEAVGPSLEASSPPIAAPYFVEQPRMVG